MVHKIYIDDDINHLWDPGYVRTPSNPKFSSKGARAIDFASKFIMTIESANLEPRGLLNI
jgi:hypothetical protein